MSGVIIPAPAGAVVVSITPDAESPDQVNLLEWPIVAVVLDSYDRRVTEAITTGGGASIPVGPGKGFIRWVAAER